MTTTEQRFWAKVEKTESCWIWKGSKRSKGYGAFVYPRDGEVVQGRAHRYSWELHRGAIPAGICVLHDCPRGDNPACVNPEHLWLGTKADNNRDLVSKGRHVAGGTYSEGNYKRGEDHHNARMTVQQVLSLRSDRSRGASFGALAKRYGISTSHAFRIANFKVWQHVEKGGI